MGYVFKSLLLVVFLFPASALSDAVTWDDLVQRDGVYRRKDSDVLFTGKTEGAIQVSFRNGKPHGLWVVYYENGYLRTKGTYKDGKKEGPWFTYWRNGQLWYKGIWKDGKKDGPWVGYYENGQLSWKETYKNDKKLSE